MKHVGDIKKLNGRTIEKVNCIIGGSPCQDLSIAGKRAGLAGERSGLFMEQIRIVKEMRENDRESGRADESIRPRYMVWENVPGALSSNKGEDFRAVLEEICRIKDETIIIPRPPKEKWGGGNGLVIGDEFSVAWRIMDAQYFGVPQRRRRIALVADFGGASAPEILFKPESLSGNHPESGETREGTAEGTENSTGAAGCNGKGWRYDQCCTLNTVDRPAVYPLENHPADNRVKMGDETNPFQTLSSRMGTGGGNVPMVYESFQKEGTGHQVYNDTLIAHALTANPNCRFAADRETYPIQNHSVRRLTPLECERLQGYPDNWTLIGEPAGTEIWKDEDGNEYPVEVRKYRDSNGKLRKVSDSARYRALGNSIGLPPWRIVLGRICEHLPDGATMGSLFDGIGGFPLIWEEINGKDSAVWASEIEEFPIAVTKERFKDDI